MDVSFTSRLHEDHFIVNIEGLVGRQENIYIYISIVRVGGSEFLCRHSYTFLGIVSQPYLAVDIFLTHPVI